MGHAPYAAGQAPYAAGQAPYADTKVFKYYSDKNIFYFQR